MVKRQSLFAARAVFPLESAWEAGTPWMRDAHESVREEASRRQGRHEERIRQRRDRTKQILHAVLTAVAVTALVFLVFVLYGLADNRWYKIITIDGGSMAPTIMPGDAIVLARPPKTVEVGMVLTLMVDGHLVTHRVVEVTADGGFATCGDANEARDDWSGNKVTVVGRFVMRIPALGRLLMFGRIGGRSPDAVSGAFLHERNTVPAMVTCDIPAIPATDPSTAPVGGEQVLGEVQSMASPELQPLPEDVTVTGAGNPNGETPAQEPTTITTQPELTQPGLIEPEPTDPELNGGGSGVDPEVRPEGGSGGTVLETVVEPPVEEQTPAG